MSEYSVIITAGGVGKRMDSILPKQFMELNGRPLLMYTLERFYHFDPTVELILTLPKEWMDYWEKLMMEFDFHIPHKLVDGGKERYDSIKNALTYCSGIYIAVHDGVRPLVSEETIRACFEQVKTHGAVIPTLPLSESLRAIHGEHTVAVDRSEFLTVQTPQCFARDILIKAYNNPFHQGFTDDASVVENAGYKIHIISGNVENIKITTQIDLKFSQILLR